MAKYDLDKEETFGNTKDRKTNVTLEFVKWVNQLRASRLSEKGYGHIVGILMSA